VEGLPSFGPDAPGHIRILYPTSPGWGESTIGSGRSRIPWQVAGRRQKDEKTPTPFCGMPVCHRRKSGRQGRQARELIYPGKLEPRGSGPVSARSASAGGQTPSACASGWDRAARPLRRRDRPIGFRAAVAVEWPRVAHLADHVQIQVGHDDVIGIAGGGGQDLAARIAEVALAVTETLPLKPVSFRVRMRGTKSVAPKPGRGGWHPFGEGGRQTAAMG